MNPARPWQVIAITFTNKAARELRERLEFALGDEQAGSAVWAYTFHTACLRILRKHVDLLGFESAFTIYDEDDKKRVILNVMKKLEDVYKRQQGYSGSRYPCRRRPKARRGLPYRKPLHCRSSSPANMR